MGTARWWAERKFLAKSSGGGPETGRKFPRNRRAAGPLGRQGEGSGGSAAMAPLRPRCGPARRCEWHNRGSGGGRSAAMR
ncbi:hypothetical protein J2S53_002328 [Actinopolyspora lacussalsi]|nr:hypothetical protein [Actinopolyspora lacussalsi]